MRLEKPFNLTYLISALFGAFCIGHNDPVVKVIGGAIFIAAIFAITWRSKIDKDNR